MRRLSIGVRLTLWYLVIFALAELLFGVGMWLILRHNLYEMVDRDLDGQVEDLRNFLEAQKKTASQAKLREEVDESYGIEHSGDYLEVYLETGDLIYRSRFLEAHQSSLVSPDQVRRRAMKSCTIEGRAFRFVFAKLSGINGHVYTVEMGVPANDVVEILSRFRSYLLMFAPLLLLAAASGGYWLSRRALSPVDALVRTAREVSGTNLNSRLQKLDTGDELQRLSDTLNEMLDRIESAFLRITQFTADASHELRTPISLIRTEAELALRRSRGEAEYKESLRQILSESERTTALIEQLLSMARADSGRESLYLQSVDLRQTLRAVVDGWQQVAIIRNLQFLARIDAAEVFVAGDEIWLRRLADILLDNALKYTPSPGSVQLSLERNGEAAVIEVQDSGIGIAEDDQSKIFERFYRVDQSRSRTQGGAGLGLSIARWIVAQHRGSLAVESRPGQGAIFRVNLPLVVARVPSPAASVTVSGQSSG
jgi:heavy metal sensor kinase